MTTPDANEIWRASSIEGYEVSSMGRVRNSVTGYVTRGIDNGNGYKRILRRQGARKVGFYVHRLVGDAFIPNPENLPTINHKNFDRSDNRVDNLEWCSYQGNNQHCRHFSKAQKRRQGVRGLTLSEVEQMRALYTSGHHSQRSLSRLFGTSQKTVWGVVGRHTYNPVRSA